MEDNSRQQTNNDTRHGLVVSNKKVSRLITNNENLWLIVIVKSNSSTTSIIGNNIFITKKICYVYPFYPLYEGNVPFSWYKQWSLFSLKGL